MLDDRFALEAKFGTFVVEAKRRAADIATAFGFEHSLNHYLSKLQSSKVHSLLELVKWNSDHFDEALTAGLSDHQRASWGLLLMYKSQNIQTRTYSYRVSRMTTILPDSRRSMRI